MKGVSCVLACILVAVQSGCVAVAQAQTTATFSSWDSSFYGTGLAADGLANVVVGGVFGNVVSYRFRARHSGALQKIRLYLIPDRVGYAAGTGGRIQVSVHTDDGSSRHLPSATKLATYTLSNILSSSWLVRHFPVLTFASPPRLTAGQLYHIVFTNVDPNPLANYLSVDALYQQFPPSPTQPTMSDADSAVLIRQTGRSWTARKGFTPVLELFFEDGWSGGIGYVESWIGAPKAISGSYAVRQKFTISGTEKKVRNVAVRVARVRGSDPLKVRLETANGTLIEQGNIPASAIPLTSPLSYVWTKYTFAAHRRLLPGQTYHLVLEATSTSTYQVFPIREGSYYGFKKTSYFSDGYAQFKQGSTWVGWTQWGTTDRRDSDLQFYFGLVP